ncbi:hypothetical protein DBR06_SOUSAS4310035 [Sousa chinensis]|uniref:Uncharacterized protein n=1 Tax=Sousa chinensis TaxID=103600 RepID=A0A484GGV2_SOUCH|nr:hypothetical protein DBR06_SOUSAS4310035 [Sousa chinensis]
MFFFFFFKLLKEVIHWSEETKKSVQLQKKVINLFTSSILISLFMLILSIIVTTSNI